MRTPMIESRGASLYTRIYGARAQPLVLIHGGPGMPGYMARLGDYLKDSWRVIDYHQRGCGRTRTDGELTVAAHMEDLRAIITATCGEKEPILVGSSWGAILALLFTADHPGWVRKVVLVGCPVIREASPAELTKEQRKRLGGRASRRADALIKALPEEENEVEANRMFRELWDTILPLYHCAPDAEAPEFAELSYATYRRGMRDTVRMKVSGAMREEFEKVGVPVVALHGDHDPSPAADVRAELGGALPNLRFLLLRNCGHFPWLEPHARTFFLGLLREELS